MARDIAEYRSGTAILIKSVDSKARPTWDFERKVRLVELFERPCVACVHDVVQPWLCTSLCTQGRHVTRFMSPSSANHRRDARRQMQVDALFFTAKQKLREYQPPFTGSLFD